MDDLSSSMINTTRNYNQLHKLNQLLDSSSKYSQAQNTTKNKNFTDKEFPSGRDAIIGFVDGPKTKAHEIYIWCRPEEFLQGNKNTLKVFDRISPDDIVQGKLADCYFLAACASIAQNPHRLERLFLSGKQYNPKGLYAVAICINGIWEEVLLDDYFPCHPLSKAPAYTKSPSNLLWPLLLEKAWAKVHLGYLNIASGKTRDALRDLTGAPTYTFSLVPQGNGKNNQFDLNETNLKAWNALMEGFKKNFAICASSRDFNKGSDRLDPTLGISGRHAYSVLGVYDFGESKAICYYQRKCIKLFVFT
jgi:calpain-15